MYYIINRETDKLELHFSKEEYQGMTDETKSTIRSNFLFSRRGGCWVSRAKRPNLSYVERIAKDLGAEYQGKTGEELTFEEKMERQADRAADRAERMDARSDAAAQRGEALQKPVEDMRGDIAFFTQPNINTSAGRAFTRKRERMFAAFDRGFEEFKKSEYYAQRAEIARRTANLENSKDKAFCDRRVKDAQKNIKAIQKISTTTMPCWNVTEWENSRSASMVRLSSVQRSSAGLKTQKNVWKPRFPASAIISPASTIWAACSSAKRTSSRATS